MSQPVLQVASYYKDVVAFSASTTQELIAAVIPTESAGSPFTGGNDPQYFLRDDLNNAKSEVTYVIPDAGTNHYYATVPSYKVITANDINIVHSKDQRIQVLSNSSSSFYPVTVKMYRHYGDNWQDGSNWHMTVYKLWPGQHITHG